MPEFSEVVRARRMVRAYRPTPVDPAAVERILDTARRGPSAGYAQGLSLVVVTDPEQRRHVAEACDEPEYIAKGFAPWVSRAPVHVIPCARRADYEQRYAEPDKADSLPPDYWPAPFWWVDAGAALMLLLLAAVDEGLAAGFLGADPGSLRTVLGIPSDVAPLGVVTIGHPAPDRRSGSLARGRKPIDEVVHRERW
ncbi:MAG: nitroreductase family protein [Egibacteraceae bacterium]